MCVVESGVGVVQPRGLCSFVGDSENSRFVNRQRNSYNLIKKS